MVVSGAAAADPWAGVALDAACSALSALRGGRGRALVVLPTAALAELAPPLERLYNAGRLCGVIAVCPEGHAPGVQLPNGCALPSACIVRLEHGAPAQLAVQRAVSLAAAIHTACVVAIALDPRALPAELCRVLLGCRASTARLWVHAAAQPPSLGAGGRSLWAPWESPQALAVTCHQEPLCATRRAPAEWLGLLCGACCEVPSQLQLPAPPAARSSPAGEDDIHISDVEILPGKWVCADGSRIECRPVDHPEAPLMIRDLASGLKSDVRVLDGKVTVDGVSLLQSSRPSQLNWEDGDTWYRDRSGPSYVILQYPCDTDDLGFLVFKNALRPELGPAVMRVTPGSRAEAAGVRVGMRIVAVGGTPIDSVTGLSDCLEDSAGPEFRATFTAYDPVLRVLAEREAQRSAQRRAAMQDTDRDAGRKGRGRQRKAGETEPEARPLPQEPQGKRRRLRSPPPARKAAAEGRHGREGGRMRSPPPAKRMRSPPPAKRKGTAADEEDDDEEEEEEESEEDESEESESDYADTEGAESIDDGPGFAVGDELRYRGGPQGRQLWRVCTVLERDAPRPGRYRISDGPRKVERENWPARKLRRLPGNLLGDWNFTDGSWELPPSEIENGQPVIFRFAHPPAGRKNQPLPDNSHGKPRLLIYLGKASSQNLLDKFNQKLSYLDILPGAANKLEIHEWREGSTFHTVYTCRLVAPGRIVGTWTVLRALKNEELKGQTRDFVLTKGGPGPEQLEKYKKHSERLSELVREAWDKGVAPPGHHLRGKEALVGFDNRGRLLVPYRIPLPASQRRKDGGKRQVQQQQPRVYCETTGQWLRPGQWVLRGSAGWHECFEVVEQKGGFPEGHPLCGVWSYDAHPHKPTPTYVGYIIYRDHTNDHRLRFRQDILGSRLTGYLKEVADAPEYLQRNAPPGAQWMVETLAEDEEGRPVQPAPGKHGAQKGVIYFEHNKDELKSTWWEGRHLEYWKCGERYQPKITEGNDDEDDDDSGPADPVEIRATRTQPPQRPAGDQGSAPASEPPTPLWTAAAATESESGFSAALAQQQQQQQLGRPARPPPSETDTSGLDPEMATVTAGTTSPQRDQMLPPPPPPAAQSPRQGPSAAAAAAAAACSTPGGGVAASPANSAPSAPFTGSTLGGHQLAELPQTVPPPLPAADEPAPAPAAAAAAFDEDAQLPSSPPGSPSPSPRAAEGAADPAAEQAPSPLPPEQPEPAPLAPSPQKPAGAEGEVPLEGTGSATTTSGIPSAQASLGADTPAPTPPPPPSAAEPDPMPPPPPPEAGAPLPAQPAPGGPPAAAAEEEVASARGSVEGSHNGTPAALSADSASPTFASDRASLGAGSPEGPVEA